MELILIVDDDLFFPARLEPLLRAAGFGTRVVEAMDGLDAAVAVERPRAVLINLGSRPDRLAWIKQCKQNAATCNLPVLAYCGHVEVELQRQAREAGADQVAANSAMVERAGEIVRRLLTRE
jgi:CheY-like chemotaxis protein